METDRRNADKVFNNRNIYFAPMEGITGHIYRTAHARHFPGIDRYYLPFIAAHATHNMKNKEKKDISPANNVGLSAIPQVLTKNVDDFLWAADELLSLGYHEVNLNFGCPSPTVTSKGKGAAFLGSPDEMDRFLEGIFSGAERRGILEKNDLSEGKDKNTSGEGIRITVKTRIGVEKMDEWERIFAVYNRYPISELIVHARTLREMYKGQTHEDIFAEILRQSCIPVCYNGNIYTCSDYRRIQDRFGEEPSFRGVMIGRGFIRNPALIQEIRSGKKLCEDDFLSFHDEVLKGYQNELFGDTHVISKMKELWWYMGYVFTNAEKPLKKIRKSKTVREYQAAVNEIMKCGICGENVF